MEFKQAYINGVLIGYFFSEEDRGFGTTKYTGYIINFDKGEVCDCTFWADNDEKRFTYNSWFSEEPVTDFYLEKMLNKFTIEELNLLGLTNEKFNIKLTKEVWLCTQKN